MIQSVSTIKCLNSRIFCLPQVLFKQSRRPGRSRKLRAQAYTRQVHLRMSLYQCLLVDSRIQAKQYLRLTVPRQVLAKTCQSVQVRHSPKAQLHLCRRAS